MDGFLLRVGLDREKLPDRPGTPSVEVYRRETLMAAPRQLDLPLKGGFGMPPFVAHSRPATCAYCGSPATTRDHVLPRCLLEKPFPPNLSTVPSCDKCNGSFSLHEQYLQIVLALIGIHPHQTTTVEENGIVDRALLRAPALDERIVGSLDAMPDGRVELRLEEERILAVARKVAFGLYICRYPRQVSFDQFVPIAMCGSGEAIPPVIIGACHYQSGLRLKPWETVQQNVFSYLFARGWLESGPGIYCLINFHCTLLAAVRCPHP